MMDTVAVPVASAWASKINWTQAVAFASMGLTFAFGTKAGIPTDVQLQMVAGIQAVQSVTTWVMKTWFTKTVTPASVANATTTTTIPVSTPVVHIT